MIHSIKELSSEDFYMLKTCLNSYRWSWETMLIKDKYYFKVFEYIFKKLIENTAKCQSILRDDSNQERFQLLHIFRKNPLHFVYVPKKLRGKRVMLGAHLKPLIKDGKLVVSFMTKYFKECILQSS